MRYRFEGMEFDAVTRTLSGPDGPIPVRAQSLAVLEHLLEQAPGVVSRDELLDAVWGHQCTSDSSVAQTIRELRAALGDSSTEPRFIETRRRIGYQFIAAIETLDPESIDRAPATSAPASSDPAPMPATGRGLGLLAIGALIILAVVAWRWTALPESTPASPSVNALALGEVAFASIGGPDSARSAALRSVLGRSLARVEGVRILDRASASTAADAFVNVRALERADGAVELSVTLVDPDGHVQALDLVGERADLSLLGDVLSRAVFDQLGLDAQAQRLASTPVIRLPTGPDVQRIYFQAIEALDASDPEGALALLDSIDDSVADEVPIRLLESRALAAYGDLLAAREITRQLLSDTELWPQRERLAIEATAARQAYEYERAADRLQALNQFFPEPSSVLRMVEAQIGAGRLEAARDALDRLERLLPQDARISLLRADLLRAENDTDGRLEAAYTARTRAESSEQPRIADVATRAIAAALIADGRLDEAETELAPLVNGAEWSTRPSLRGSVNLLLARIDFERGELDAARTFAEQAEADFLLVPDTAGIAEARILQGSALEQAGQVEAAVQRLETALPLLEELGRSASLARAHVNLGIARTSLGDVEAAQQHLGRAGVFYREAGDRRGEGAALLNQGSLLARSNRPAESELAFERAVEAFTDADDARGQAIALGNLASNASQRGETGRAIELNGRALTLFREIGANFDAARTAYNLGLVHRRLGDLARAESMVREAAERFLEQDSTTAAARALAAHGSMLIDGGRFEDAEQVLRRLDELPIDSPMRAAEIETLRGELAEARGFLDRAREHFVAARALREATPDWQRMSDLDLARIALATGNAVQAEQEARRLAVQFREAQDVYPLIDALLLQAESLVVQGRKDEADDLLQRIEERIDAHRDARQNLEMALLRAQVLPAEAARARLEWVRQTASEAGYAPLAGRATGLLNAQYPASPND